MPFERLLSDPAFKDLSRDRRRRRVTFAFYLANASRIGPEFDCQNVFFDRPSSDFIDSSRLPFLKGRKQFGSRFVGGLCLERFAVRAWRIAIER